MVQDESKVESGSIHCVDHLGVDTVGVLHDVVDAEDMVCCE